MIMPIRKVSKTGSGSARVVLPKSQLDELGLVDDDGSVSEGHLAFSSSDDGELIIRRVD